MLQGQDGLALRLVRVEFRQRYGRLEGVLDLAAVPRGLAFPVQLLVVFLRVFVDLVRFGVEGFLALGESFEVHLPDLEGGAFVEGGVVEADMDPGFEGFVEVADFVGGEEEDAGVELQDSEEDGNYAVAPHVLAISRL